ncbi:hypothetical protein LSAT2_009272 [Lamellibrachia satsuma]|nr:hypothetical protein LSAT2_009272 [Lamellibrachia satsuma]
MASAAEACKNVCRLVAFVNRLAQTVSPSTQVSLRTSVRSAPAGLAERWTKITAYNNTVQQHKHTDDQYSVDTSKMENVRRLLVLSLVCLLLCQMVPVIEACGKKKCNSPKCRTFCCYKSQYCGRCHCVAPLGGYEPPLKC